MSGSTKNTTAAGIVISVLVIAAVASIGYFQLRVAPQLFTTTSTSTSTSSTGPLLPGHYVNVTIPSGASTPPTGYSGGQQKTQYGFDPDVITVVIGKNNTVFWNNMDAAPHTATSDQSGAFDTGNIGPGATGTYTFTTPGTYTYHCNYHPWMQGTVIVKSG